jgi:hypothetical protein
MPHRILKVSEHGMLDAYDATLKARGFKSDPAQRAAAQRLQGLYSELIAFKAARRGTIRKLLARPKQPRSVYFWGGVGRGKSFLMDCFYDSVPYQRKRRVHFHAFMQEVQNDLKNLNHEPDPLQKVADRIARQTRLLCFDEFHVSDIADAMILGRLLDALFARGTVRDDLQLPARRLYPNGLQRINFLPTIEMIKRRFDVVEVDHGTDYRLRTLEQMDAFLCPDDAADRHLAPTSRRSPAPRAGRRDRGARAQAQGAAPGAGRDLVRFRHPVRRQPLAERLPRDRPRESHADPLPRPQDERRDGLRGAPLHLAGRRALRPPGQAAGERRVPGLRPLRGRAAGQRVPPHRQPSHRDALPRLPRRSPPGRRARASAYASVPA